MSAADPRRGSRRARSVINAMLGELQRQVREGALISCGSINRDSHVVIEGSVDLAMLGYVTELAMKREGFA